MPLPEFIENEEAGPDQTDLDIRQKEIKQRLDRARKLETVDAMRLRYLEYMERDGEWDD
jgi:hypothetical protein